MRQNHKISDQYTLKKLIFLIISFSLTAKEKVPVMESYGHTFYKETLFQIYHALGPTDPIQNGKTANEFMLDLFKWNQHIKNWRKIPSLSNLYQKKKRFILQPAISRGMRFQSEESGTRGNFEGNEHYSLVELKLNTLIGENSYFTLGGDLRFYDDTKTKSGSREFEVDPAKSYFFDFIAGSRTKSHFTFGLRKDQYQIVGFSAAKTSNSRLDSDNLSLSDIDLLFITSGLHIKIYRFKRPSVLSLKFNYIIAGSRKIAANSFSEAAEFDEKGLEVSSNFWSYFNKYFWYKVNASYGRFNGHSERSYIDGRVSLGLTY